MNYKTSDGKSIRIKAIVAMDQTGIIGYDNDLIFHNEKDLAMFKQKTTGHVCVMGSKTFFSIGRILPNRLTVIVSKHEKDVSEKLDEMAVPENTPKPIIVSASNGFQLAHTICQIAQGEDDSTIWVCGGAKIYDLLRPFVKTWIITSYHINLLKEGVAKGYLPEGFSPKKLRKIDPQFPGVYSMMEKGEWNGLKYAVRSFTKDLVATPLYTGNTGYDGIIERRRDRHSRN